MRNRQHYFPQMMLKEWTNGSDNKVWCYYRNSLKPQYLHIKNLFMENALYRVNGSDRIEHRLAKLESNFGNIKEKIYKNDLLEIQENEEVKVFFSFLLARDSVMRNEDWSFLETDILGGQNDNTFANTLEMRAHRILEVLRTYNLELRHIPYENPLSFILCDHPYLGHEQKNGQWIYFFPFGPKHYLLFHPSNSESSYSFSHYVTQTEVKFINKIAVKNMSEYFIYDMNDSSMFDLLK